MAHDQPPSSALETAVSIAGGQSAFGRLIGKSQSTVWDWIRYKRPLPAEHVLTAERETGVSRHELRPDLYPIDDLPVAGTIAASSGSGSCDPLFRKQLEESAR
jgi:DNA-binding transcriptional regulator YdaS (Cro superfamily)